MTAQVPIRLVDDGIGRCAHAVEGGELQITFAPGRDTTVSATVPDISVQ
jgi:hypothetical protein